MFNQIEAAPMCFACGPANPIGLKIKFIVDGDECTAEFTPDENHAMQIPKQSGFALASSGM
jgi:hypothetical protein